MSMDLRRLATPADFLAHAGNFLLEHEAEHGLLLGVASAATAFPAGAFAAVVYRGGAVRAAALRTTSHLILARADGPDDLEQAALRASAYLDDQATVLWENDGQVVSMAKAVNPT